MFKKYLIVALAVLMIASMTIVPRGSATGSGTNPPPSYGTFIVNVGTGAFASTLDPANCYDTASAEIIFNSMETVIYFLGEDYFKYRPMLATQVTVAQRDPAAPAYTNYTVYFKIRGTNPADGSGTIPFQNRCRVDDGAATWGNYYLTTTDVEYSWERFLVHDFVGAAAWLWYEPLLACYAHDSNDPAWGTKIDNAIQKNNTHVWINVCNPGLATTPIRTFAPVNMFLTDDGTFDPNFVANTAAQPTNYPLKILMQVVSQSWNAIYSKAWVLNYINVNLPGIGGGLPADWDGTYANWINYTGWAADQSPFDKLPVAAGTPGVMCGTGPYVLDTYAAATGWSSVIYDLYYRGWPAQDFSPPYPNVDPTIVPSGIYPGGYCRRITEIQTSTSNMIANLISGAADLAGISRARCGEVHAGGNRLAETLAGIRLNYPIPTLQVECMNYIQLVDNPGGANTYGKINANDTLSADGVPANFFTNAHVRLAMTYLINFTYHIQTLFYGEAYQPVTCSPNGLPYVNMALPKYGPDPNLAGAKAELDLATFGGTPLNTVGFKVPVCVYSAPGGVRDLSCQNLVSMIKLVGSTYSLPYDAQEYLVPWNDFIPGIDAHLFAIYRVGWLADYADIHNFLFPFAHSQGTYAHSERYQNPQIDADLAQAARTPDGPARQALYYDAEQRFYNDNPSVHIMVPVGRGYQREWVQGHAVEYNALYPGIYARYEWKWLYMRGNVDYNRFCNMGDLNHILNAFGSYIGKSGMPVIQDRWNFHCDVDGNPKDSSPGGDGGWRDRKIDMWDISATLDNLFKTEPLPVWATGLTGW